ncbi:9934_t:CDS:2 [Cetraspora pellucida]|uniref:Mediator of RNA polymerase II transcription subunit 31 n=1 Tax=Cetraspora pellucida TaxID=1433469 RepID=A0A9N9I788_9GLOM|nr:9934_t:CDS:2 [Cetraspora pellucida]
MSDHSTPIDKPQSPTSTTDAENDKRFQIELEFVQCLANPWYLNNLAQRGFFQDPAFLNYLNMVGRSLNSHTSHLSSLVLYSLYDIRATHKFKYQSYGRTLVMGIS